MKKIISFLNADIKIINSYFLFTIVLIILVCVGYSSYALFSFTKTSNNVIEGTVGELKKSGVDTLIKLTNNQNNSGLYTITHEADTTLQIGANESVTEYRYRGASPKNYVTFNNEVWRILGVFPTDDGTGKIENRIKIIRNESIGQYVADSNNSVEIAWPETNMNNNLNGTYLSSLTSETQNMIGNAKYYLGGYDGSEYQQGLVQTPVDMYSYERKIKNTKSNEFYYGSNPNSFIGKIGAMYASDYGYASSNCETKKLYDQNSSNYDIRACNDTNWLYNIKNGEWLLDQNPDRGLGVNFYYTNKNGYIENFGGMFSTHNFHVRPVLYLKSNVKITGGNGTSSNPYILGL
ncbi:MAG: hypothetical protein BHW63_01140 [Mycoplasma sp. CAG:611_25_7]|nr:MAG: hypothetical protein BHW63_01140 [Mycoplasma sp. CAG:611_25_7]